MLAIHDLAFKRNNSYLLQNIHCTLHPSEVLQICGANGSGKSTLLRILAGFIEPIQGKITWNNVSIHQQRESYQQALHYLGHHNGIKPHLTVYENMKLYCALFNVNEEHIEFAIQTMELTKKKHALTHDLSAGQSRRLALARLLLKPSRLWILDEPATALDQQGQQLFLQLAAGHLLKKGAIVLATHQPLDFDTNVSTLWLGEKNV